MGFWKKFSAGQLPLQVLLLIVMLVASACDFSSNPDSNLQSYEGPPVVRIETPLNGDNYQEGVGVNIQARIENAGPDIIRVSVEVDGIIVGELTSPNTSGAASFTVNTGWPASSPGQHSIGISASRSDGTVSAPASVTINVVAAPQANDMEENPEPTLLPTSSEAEPTQDTEVQQIVVSNTPPPTNPPPASDTPVPAPPTPSRPQVHVTTGANVRSGPGIVFDPPIGSLAAGAVANILAINPAGTWYKIQYYNGDAWISAQVVTVTGDISSLPREAGPPTPIPATNTPVPTATSTSRTDLIIDGANSNHPTFVCNQAANLRITVVNAGADRSPATTVIAEDIHGGQVTAMGSGNVPELGSNENVTVTISMTVSAFFSEEHTMRVRVDPNNQVPESNNDNNSYSYNYVLGSGGC